MRRSAESSRAIEQTVFWLCALLKFWDCGNSWKKGCSYAETISVFMTQYTATRLNSFPKSFSKSYSYEYSRGTKAIVIRAGTGRAKSIHISRINAYWIGIPRRNIGSDLVLRLYFVLWDGSNYYVLSGQIFQPKLYPCAVLGTYALQNNMWEERGFTNGDADIIIIYCRQLAAIENMEKLARHFVESNKRKQNLI